MIELRAAVQQLSVQVSDQELEAWRGQYPKWEFLTKLELAVVQLSAALREDKLAVWVQSETGAMVPLSGLNLTAAPFSREIMVGGVIRSAAGDRLASYDGWLVWLDRPAFEAWLEQRLRPDRPETAPGSCDDEQIAELQDDEELTPRVKAVVAVLNDLKQEMGRDPDVIDNDPLLVMVKERLKPTTVSMRTLQRALAARRR